MVTGVESFGLFVQGTELPAEGLIHLSSLADDQYRFDRGAHTLSGHRSGNRYRLGDPLRVAVLRVDQDRRELDFRLVRRYKRAAPPGATSTRGRGKGKAVAKGKPGTSQQSRRSPRRAMRRDRGRR